MKFDQALSEVLLKLPVIGDFVAAAALEILVDACAEVLENWPTKEEISP